MIKIYSNHNKQDVVYSFSTGQSFPDVQGKLIRIEVSGSELKKIAEKNEIPVSIVEGSCFIWHDKNAGKILKILKEMF